MESNLLSSSEIRSRFLEFFKKRGHAILPSASLVPENDPSVLFNTAGMQPLVPYLMGQKHPLGNRLASCQKCVRTGDIEEVGNHKNLTFFEMLGNWSLGDYFKEDAIKWSYEFLTSKDEGLGLDSSRLYVTVFEGDDNAPRDLEAVEIWKQYIPENRIYFLPAKNNWWSPGDNGPCGPDTEMFYDVTPDGLGDMSHDEYVAADDDGRVVEIWNDVFMQYVKKDGAVIGKLEQKNVDTGSGLERITMIVQGKTSVYDAGVFAPVMQALKTRSGDSYNERSARIVADHIRTSVFMIADGVFPGNKDRGYILRRLIRRASVQSKKLNLLVDDMVEAFKLFRDCYADIYPEVMHAEGVIVFQEEINKFQKTLDSGLKEFEKAEPLLFDSNISYDTIPTDWNPEKYISAQSAFDLFQTFGFPVEITTELAHERGWVVDINGFNALLKEHQEKSRSGSEQKFKGGLGGTTDKIIRSHTAHHLLLAALRKVLGEHVHQRGSNITDERIRIDFAHDAKMTDEQKSAVEKLVNEWIKNDLPMQHTEMPRIEAETIGAEMEFGVKYPDMVSVYFIGNDLDTAISKEFCGGPHIDHTGLIGTFKIQKEEASSAGVRRIKATIE